MENKNSVLVFSIIFLIIGVFVGWLICSNKEARTAIPTGTHMMGNGEMMNNNGMGMNGAMDSMMAGLSGKTGDAFDKAFIEEMIMHHEGAVAMAQAALKNAKHPEIKIMANAIISAQTSEINQMKGWLKDWYGEEYKDNN
jgi:uncharacterized protein (DUF305 family)